MAATRVKCDTCGVEMDAGNALSDAGTESDYCAPCYAKYQIEFLESQKQKYVLSRDLYQRRIDEVEAHIKEWQQHPSLTSEVDK